jgi:hypothetical protein
MNRVMSVRLTPEQDDDVRRRAERREIPDSEALRELVDMGRLQDRAVTQGLVVTKRAAKLLGKREGAVVAYASFEDVTPAAAHALQLEVHEVEAIEHGAVVLATVEELDACE